MNEPHTVKCCLMLGGCKIARQCDTRPISVSESPERTSYTLLCDVGRACSLKFLCPFYSSGKLYF
ncbi:MAG: hypothetical protein ACD_28C00363G0002 [uncultured bacterium]|nr:MAG: hypothetical protein ACD_28C00363G0002 [uncultured bacterium]